MEYVITTTILIEAPDERSAEDAIEQMVDSGSVLGVMGHRNVSIEPSKAHRANIRMIGPTGRVQRRMSA